jgi:hypothetical protein
MRFILGIIFSCDLGFSFHELILGKAKYLKSLMPFKLNEVKHNLKSKLLKHLSNST